MSHQGWIIVRYDEFQRALERVLDSPSVLVLCFQFIQNTKVDSTKWNWKYCGFFPRGFCVKMGSDSQVTIKIPKSVLPFLVETPTFGTGDSDARKLRQFSSLWGKKNSKMMQMWASCLHFWPTIKVVNDFWWNSLKDKYISVAFFF